MPSRGIGHRLGTTARTGREYTAGSSGPPAAGTVGRARGSGSPPAPGSGSSARLRPTCHPWRPRAAPRTALRAALRPAVPHQSPADPAPATDRAGDGERAARRRRSVRVPDRFAVQLHPDDLAGLLGRARRGRRRISPTPPSLSPALTATPRRPAAGRASIGRPAASPARRRPGRRPRWSTRAGDGPGGAAADAATHDGLQAPAARAPPTRSLRAVGRDGRRAGRPPRRPPLTIGRSPDNGLVARRRRVSRHHARLQARRGALILTDLGRHNGSGSTGSPSPRSPLAGATGSRSGTPCSWSTPSGSD